MDALDFSGKKALVVCGSSGIGNGIAQAFRAQGGDVHVCGTRSSANDYTNEHGSNLEGVTYVQADVGNRNAIDRLAANFESIDVLVLCQGIVLYGREEFVPSGWNAVMDINLSSVMHVANRFHGMLSESNGSVIIVSSTGAFKALIGNPAYGASKAAAVSLCKSLGAAWARDGVRVNGIAPGLVETKLTTATMQNKERRDARLKSISLRRFGTTQDMAGVALFLASQLASYIQGQTIIVDGGMDL